MKQPLVSIIVPTRNSAATLDACLASISKQSYKNIELIVVDRDSTDDTKTIAKKYTELVFNKDPERSVQRNYGAKKAKGEYVVFIDSDMELTSNVIKQCIAAKDERHEAVIIPEESFGVGFWAQCKKLERSFYIGNDAIEAARFINKNVFIKAGSYNEDMVSGEDWDLNNRVRKITDIARIDALILHNEGKINLKKTLAKKYYYAKQAGAYMAQSYNQTSLTGKTGPLARYKLFFSKPGLLLKNPLTGIGMLFMKTSEYAFGLVGLKSKKSDVL